MASPRRRTRCSVWVEGTAFYLFIHDDVRLAPDAVTSLVAEAFRADGGVVGPKLVDWDDPSRLKSVGYSVVRTARVVDLRAR